MELKESGVLLHISSLPGKYGIGTLGENAYKFIDFLAQAGFSYWEILPITETSFSNSPYQTLSAFGLNHYFIDFDLLVKDGLLN
ncbi:MAG TPA: 4-alpha-glucanotransferase, partial [Firmicutes bacterium]|nr:4-alpha-glucanotransferase [Bacillota bacterium]